MNAICRSRPERFGEQWNMNKYRERKRKMMIRVKGTFVVCFLKPKCDVMTEEGCVLYCWWKGFKFKEKKKCLGKKRNKNILSLYQRVSSSFGFSLSNYFDRSSSAVTRSVAMTFCFVISCSILFFSVFVWNVLYVTITKKIRRRKSFRDGCFYFLLFHIKSTTEKKKKKQKKNFRFLHRLRRSPGDYWLGKGQITCNYS